MDQGKRGQENGPKAEKYKTERATGLGRRTRGNIEKWDQTDSPEIPDMGETSEIPRPPFRGMQTILCITMMLCITTIIYNDIVYNNNIVHYNNMVKNKILMIFIILCVTILCIILCIIILCFSYNKMLRITILLCIITRQCIVLII